MAATFSCLLTNAQTNKFHLQAKRENYNTRPAHTSAGLSESMTGCCDKHHIPQTRQAGGSTAGKPTWTYLEINMEAIFSRGRQQMRELPFSGRDVQFKAGLSG